MQGLSALLQRAQQLGILLVRTILTMDFGNVTVRGDNNPTNNSFVIHLKVRVDNVAANVDGTTLSNHVSMTYGASPHNHS